MGIPRWLTGANLLGIVLAFTLAIPFGARANHQSPPTTPSVSRVLPANGYAWTAARLAWTDPNGASTTQYALQRSTSASFNANVVEYRIARNTSDFMDETFTPCSNPPTCSIPRFHYRVRGYVGADPSNWSGTTSITNGTGPLPSAAPQVPTELATEPGPSGGVRFSWKDNSTTETFFRVERGAAEQGQNLTWEWRGSVSMASGSGSRVAFVDPDGVVGEYYRVTVFNGKGSNRSYAQAHTQPGVPGVTVPPNVVPSSIGVPSNLQTLIPSDVVGTVNGIVSPLASSASGLLSNVPAPSGVVSSLNGLVATATGVASVASPYVSLVSSVIANPTGLAPPVGEWRIWFGIRQVGAPFFLAQFWLLPVNCTPLNCLPPPDFTCAPVPFAQGVEYCFIIETPPSR